MSDDFNIFATDNNPQIINVMKIKTILLFLALCVTMGVSAQTSTSSKDRRINPGNEVAMKSYKEALKKEMKNPSYSRAMFESLAKDGYAPAQYKMYKIGKENKWLELAAEGGHFEAATSSGFLSQRLTQCEEVTSRCRSCATRASKGGTISEQEVQKLWDDRQQFDQLYRQLEMMQGYLFAAAIAKDANYFPPTYKGKKGIKKAQWELEALCGVYRDRAREMEWEFAKQMDIIKKSTK